MRLIYPPLTTITTPHTTQQQQQQLTFTQIQNKHALNSTNSAQTHPQRGQHLEPDDVTAAAQLRLKRVITVVKVTRGDFNRWVYRHRATLNRRDTSVTVGDIKSDRYTFDFHICFMDDTWFVDVRFQMVIYVYFTLFILLFMKLKNNLIVKTEQLLINTMAKSLIILYLSNC